MREVLMQNYAPGKDAGMAHPPHPPSRPKINNLPAKSNYTKFTHTHTNRDLERVDINVPAKFARRRMQLWEWERKRRGSVYEYCSPDLLIIDAQAQEVTWDQTYSPSLAAWLRVFLSPCHCLAQSSGAETCVEERERYARGFVLQGVPFVGRKFARFPLWLCSFRTD